MVHFQMANKLYQLNYPANSIEQFARKMLLSVVHQHTSDTDLSQSGSAEQREGEVIIGLRSRRSYISHISVKFLSIMGALGIHLWRSDYRTGQSS
ncbi:uncharacterized protein [Euphorbia lathyris]|uniref:uncharacterized protein isoform X3 n=1 Tax=Euphorbia lathyris TaxID=212925 RepID=UPI00331435A0